MLLPPDICHVNILIRSERESQEPKKKQRKLANKKVAIPSCHDEAFQEGIEA
jgi:hypothetical protein